MTNRRALVQLIIVRFKEFLREPEAIFWTYGFPLLMVIGLGIAFRNQPEEVIQFDLVDGPGAAEVEAALADDKRFEVQRTDQAEALARLRRNKVVIVVDMTSSGACTYHFDPTNTEGRAARSAIDDALQRAAGRDDPMSTQDELVTTPGARYVDFLVPGLIGMNLMGGGLWGIGFTLVDMRVRNLLKRMQATPMRRSDFLMSLVGMRILFFIPEMVVLLFASRLLFDVPIRGSLVTIVAVAFVGSIAFSGLGLLVACRAKRIETVTGLMNLVMLPMWLMSGIFFSSERFPDFLQPFIQALPLTQLNNALRSVILDGDGFTAQWSPLVILTGWGVVTFILALRWFRWHD